MDMSTRREAATAKERGRRVSRPLRRVAAALAVLASCVLVQVALHPLVTNPEERFPTGAFTWQPSASQLSPLSPERVRVLDSLAHLNSADLERLTLRSGQTLQPPFRAEITLAARQRLSFRLVFADGPRGQYAVAYDDDDRSKTGLYLDRDGQSRRLAPMALQPRSRDTTGAVKVELQVSSEGRVSFGVDGQRGAATVDMRGQQGTFALEPTPPALLMAVDRVRIVEIAGGMLLERLDIDFHLAPVHLDLGRALGLEPRSMGLHLVSLVLMLLVGFGLGELWLLAARRGFTPGTTPAGTLLLLAPLDGAVMLCFRAMLSLSTLAALIALGGLLTARALAGARRGAVAASGNHGGREDWRWRLVLAAGAALLIWAVLVCDGMLYNHVTAVHVPLLLWLLVPLTVMLVLVPAALAAPLPGVTWAVGLGQLAPMMLLGNFQAMPLAGVKLAAVLLPLLLLTVIHLARSGQRKATRRLAACALLACAPLLVEAVMRSWEYPERIYSWDRGSALSSSWDFERHSSLLRGGRAPERISAAHRTHRLAREANTTRIVALGSSSTYGAGVQDERRHSYPAQLQRLLGQQLDSKVEVINAGVSGAYFTHLYIYLWQVLLPSRPDLVVIYFGDNGDGPDGWAHYLRARDIVKRYPHIDSQQELTAALRLRWPTELLTSAFVAGVKSRTFMAAVMALESVSRRIERRWPTPRDMVCGPREECLARSAALAVKACVEGGVPALLVPEVSLPDVKARAANPGEPVAGSAGQYRIFSALAREHAGKGVHYLDVLEQFPPEVADKVMVDRVHMIEQGYLRLARLVAAHITKQGLLGAAAAK